MDFCCVRVKRANIDGTRCVVVIRRELNLARGSQFDLELIFALHEYGARGEVGNGVKADLESSLSVLIGLECDSFAIWNFGHEVKVVSPECYEPVCSMLDLVEVAASVVIGVLTARMCAIVLLVDVV